MQLKEELAERQIINQLYKKLERCFHDIKSEYDIIKTRISRKRNNY